MDFQSRYRRGRAAFLFGRGVRAPASDGQPATGEAFFLVSAAGSASVDPTIGLVSGPDSMPGASEGEDMLCSGFTTSGRVGETVSGPGGSPSSVRSLCQGFGIGSAMYGFTLSI